MLTIERLEELERAFEIGSHQYKVIVAKKLELIAQRQQQRQQQRQREQYQRQKQKAARYDQEQHRIKQRELAIAEYYEKKAGPVIVEPSKVLEVMPDIVCSQEAVWGAKCRDLPAHYPGDGRIVRKKIRDD